MKKLISDEKFRHGLKVKFVKWAEEQLKLPAGSLPEIDILEVCEYPVYRLTLAAEVQTRKITSFNRAGTPPPLNTESRPQTAETDPWSIKQEEIGDITNGRKIFDLPGSIKSTPCKKCNGAGKFQCPDCQGQKTVYCLSCRGDGKLECPRCRKTLKIHCQQCQGHGKVYSEVKKAYDDCPQCEGKGSYPCTECQGGQVACTACGGTGRVPCAKCEQAGSLECAECSGKGSFISGSCVEITAVSANEKIEIANKEIPENITGGEFPAISWVKEIAGQGAPPAGDEVSKQADILQKRIEVPHGGRILKEEVTAEKKIFYFMKYKFGVEDGGVWFLMAGDKVVFEKRFSNKIYSALLAGLTATLDSGGSGAALKTLKLIENIPDLRQETEKIRKKLLRGVASSYITGGAAGAVLSCFVILMFGYMNWHASQHFYQVAAMSAAGCITLAAVFAALLGKVNPAFLDNRVKRVAAGSLIPAILSLAIVFMSAKMQINPAAQLDANQMKQEYADHFPFGLRTLANDEDIEFLQKLIDKYSPSGVDVSLVRKDLEWLREKKKNDSGIIEKIEQTAQNIRRASDHKEQTQKKRRGKPRIIIK